MQRTLKSLFALGLVTASLTAFVACGDDDSAAATPAGQATQATTQAAPATTSATTSANTAAVLTEAINEEFKARATYQAVIDKFGQQVVPFANIVNSENTHVEQWATLLEQNNIPVPPDPYTGKVAAPASIAAACTVGVAAEKEDVALYDRLLTETTNPAILAVMQQQRQVSQENHLTAFQRCAG